MKYLNRNYFTKMQDSHKFRILTVDSDEIAFEMYKELFNDDKIDLFWARNGREALDFLDKNPCPDLIFTEILLPEIDGITLSKKVDRHFPGIKIAIISAQNKHLYDIDIESVVTYFTKPFDLDELTNFVYQQMNKAGKNSMVC